MSCEEEDTCVSLRSDSISGVSIIINTISMFLCSSFIGCT